MQWFKNLFRRRSNCDGPDREQQAKLALDTLRREELSVGAQMRRGIPVNSAPGQAFGVGAQSADAQSAARVMGSATARPSAASQPERDPENFPLSMAVSAATGSMALGYLAGSSAAGAFLGSSMQSSHSSSDSCESSFRGSEGCGGSSDERS